MRHEGHGAVLVTPITQEKFQYLGFAFVDDTDNCAMGDTPEAAIHNMQELIDAWDTGACVTGGKLVPEKSHWYLVAYISDGCGGYHYLPPDPESHQLFLTADDGSRVPIKLLSLWTAERTLGVHYSPAGTLVKQKEVG